MGAISSCCTRGDEISSLDRTQLGAVLDGIMVQQKFTSKTNYSRMFIWINLDTFTIHMSEHSSKERKHKEASLGDVTKVASDLPQKVDVNDVKDPNTSLTITFKRGGGIDLKFDTKEVRDLWLDTLTKITRKNSLQ